MHVGLGGKGMGGTHKSQKCVFDYVCFILHIGLIWSDFVVIAHPPGHCLQQV